jgi:replication-associated recombination protein RarA
MPAAVCRVRPGDLIGATTENPSFEVNSALLSRSQVYVLKSLDESELRQLVDRAREGADPAGISKPPSTP